MLAPINPSVPALLFDLSIPKSLSGFTELFVGEIDRLLLDSTISVDKIPALLKCCALAELRLSHGLSLDELVANSRSTGSKWGFDSFTYCHTHYLFVETANFHFIDDCILTMEQGEVPQIITRKAAGLDIGEFLQQNFSQDKYEMNYFEDLLAANLVLHSLKCFKAPADVFKNFLHLYDETAITLYSQFLPRAIFRD